MPHKSNTVDPPARGAEISENLPVLKVEEMSYPAFISDEDIADDVVDLVEDLPTAIEGEFVPDDSTDPLLVDNAVVNQSPLDAPTISIFELLDDEQRGLRLYLGKPSEQAIARAMRTGKGVGIVIEAEPSTGVVDVRLK